MKKIVILFMLFSIGLYALGQNSLRTEGVSSTVTIIPLSTAASTGNYTLPVILGEADWSVQIIPVAGGTLTADSCYATIQTFVSNSSGTAVWSEPKRWDSFATGGLHTYYLRDTIANATVAASGGVLIQDRAFQNSRIKIVINRPQSTDSVNYKIYYVIKYPQSNPQR